MNLGKKFYYALILVLCMLQFTACKSRKDNTDNSSVEVFTINDKKIYLDEVLYRVWESENENAYYSKDYKEKYGESYWESEIVEGTTVSASLKQELYDGIVRDTLLYQKAVEEGFSLTEKEKKLYEDEANTEWDAWSKDMKQSIGAKKDLLIRLKEEKGLVEKYFSSVLEKYEVDEDKIKASIQPGDYKEIDIKTIGYSKFLYGDDGTETKKSEEENQMGLERLQEVAEKAKTVEDLNELLSDDSDTLETEEISIIPGDTACEKEIEDAALSMKPGETSDIIKTELGYYIVRVVDNSSSDAYEEAVHDAIMQAKYNQFDKYYSTVKKAASIETAKKWEQITVGGTVIKES